jgi:hypothetical protein
MEAVTGMLPILRLPWRRKTRPQTAPEPVPAPSEPPAPPTEPAWRHVPPEPQDRATKCGQCGEDIPDRAVSFEFCGSVCAARWSTAFISWLNAEAKWLRDGDMGPVHSCEPRAVTGPRLVPDIPPEPAWMARITAGERKKADRVIAERKAPSAGDKAA